MLDRSKFIGSSDVSTLMGDCDHLNEDGSKRTSADLYVEKKKGLKKQENAAMWLGNALEKPVLLRYCKENGIRYWAERYLSTLRDKVKQYVRLIDLQTNVEITDMNPSIKYTIDSSNLPENETVLFYQPGQYVHPEIDYFCCQPDALLMDSKGNILEVIECKTTSEYATYFKTHSIPKDWLYQALSTLMILGAEKETFIILNTTTNELEPPYTFTVYDFAKEGEPPLLEYQRRCDTIIKSVIRFWESYTQNIIPDKFQEIEPLPDVKTVGVLKSDDENLNDTVALYVNALENYKTAKMALELLEKHKNDLGQIILDLVVPNNKDVLETKNYTVEIQYRNGSQSIDKKKLLANYPEVDLTKVVKYGEPSCYIKKAIKKESND